MSSILVLGSSRSLGSTPLKIEMHNLFVCCPGKKKKKNPPNRLTFFNKSAPQYQEQMKLYSCYNQMNKFALLWQVLSNVMLNIISIKIIINYKRALLLIHSYLYWYFLLLMSVGIFELKIVFKLEKVKKKKRSTSD